jgi:hypothetical protein
LVLILPGTGKPTGNEPVYLARQPTARVMSRAGRFR